MTSGVLLRRRVLNRYATTPAPQLSMFLSEPYFMFKETFSEPAYLVHEVVDSQRSDDIGEELEKT